MRHWSSLHTAAGVIAALTLLTGTAMRAAEPAAMAEPVPMAPSHLVPCASTGFTVTSLFDTLPVDLTTVAGVVPLGHVNGTSHIVPISTIYFYAPSTFDGTAVTPAFTDQAIVAPGDVTITSLRWEPNSGGSLIAGDDWYVTFRPCNEIRFTYHHLNAITGPASLVARARQVRRGVNAVCDHDDTGAATACSGLARVNVSAGDVIGTVYRRNQTSFNFTAIDQRDPSTYPPPPPGAAVDPSRYDLTYDQIVALETTAGVPIPRDFTRELYAEIDPSRSKARCALDYFTPPVRALMEAKLGSFDGTILRTAAPLCGQVFQDNLDGALQGGWFPETLTTPFAFSGEDGLAAFIGGNVTPTTLYFSIGPDAAPDLHRVVSFPYSGSDGPDFHNLSFKGAIYRPSFPPDAQPVYCWDGLVTAETDGGATITADPVPGDILVQFTSPTRMRFEYQIGGSCAARTFTGAAHVFVR
jgi:hypothetical protein